MISLAHKQHIKYRSSHSDCFECRADTERRFVDTTPWRYAHVRDYLAYVRPLLALIRAGNDSVEARVWHRKFILALDRRITLKNPPRGRKYCDSYLERFRQFRGMKLDRAYLMRFASRGASCLDW